MSVDIFVMELIIVCYLVENNWGSFLTTFIRDDDADEDDENGVVLCEGVRMLDDMVFYLCVMFNIFVVLYYLC